MDQPTKRVQPDYLKILMQVLVALAICFLAAAVGGMVTEPNLGWYQTLQKPSFNPPDWIFGPVWTLLYTAMAGALFWIWRVDVPSEEKQTAYRWFGAQLILNVLWSVAFFYMHSPLLGTIDAVALLIAICGTIAAFWRLSRGAALLLVPYLFWVMFATALTFSLWRLND
ncbi:TspO/MBR family protein [Methyloligella halotolerans]|uniref:TspO/MBR family protein n=1 Tax=Methyloligella halotolerans TaxID=1177755 RepID=A0A1E2RV59_9HYPH|nr:TspO/MBR family protein [Methyloligella halotolerans]ODA66114.1 TspO/MBR family protein [Methyloligella halotolerans]